jgi:hypothetical protein
MVGHLELGRGRSLSDGRRLLPYAQLRSMGYVLERIGDGVVPN